MKITPSIPGTTDVAQRDIHLPVHLYATHRVNDRFAFGIGINNPFGLSTDWDPETSSTRYVATFSKVVTTEVNPNVAYKLNDDLSVAFGIAYVQLRATLENDRLTWAGPGLPALIGIFRSERRRGRVGIECCSLYKVAQNVNVGLSYRSRIKIDVDGDARTYRRAASPSLAPERVPRRSRFPTWSSLASPIRRPTSSP